MNDASSNPMEEMWAAPVARKLSNKPTRARAGLVRRLARSLHYFTDLHHAWTVGIVALVCNELGGRGCQGTLHLGYAAEEQVPHRMIRRRRAWRKAADPAVDLRPHQPARGEEPTREFEMRAEIVAPVEAGSGSGGVHDAESDHG